MTRILKIEKPLIEWFQMADHASAMAERAAQLTTAKRTKA